MLSRCPLKCFNYKKRYKNPLLQLQYLLLLGQGIFIVWSLLLSAGYFYIYSTMKKVMWCLQKSEYLNTSEYSNRILGVLAN